MGTFISAPISAVSECLGVCSGAFLGACCFQLATAGRLSSARASSFMLVWLQVFGILLAWLFSKTAENWLPWTCDKLGYVGVENIGVCGCRLASAESDCWSCQMVYRVEASTTTVFVALLCMTISGCVEGAARSYSVAKFLSLVVLLLVSLFLPNRLLDGFGYLAAASSSIFLLLQSVLLIDCAYMWAETWKGNALQAQRREARGTGIAWYSAILMASATLVLGAIGVFIYMFRASTDGFMRGADVAATALSLALLILSITDIFPSGGILPAAVMMAYAAWLACSAMSMLPSWAEVSLCAASVVALALGAGAFSREEDTHSPLLAVEAREAGALAFATGQPVSSAETQKFGIHCALHTSAALYVACSLTPRTALKIPDAVSDARIAAIFIALGLYGWSLIAPTVLTTRIFQ
eukprot:TRINITY_DN92780_c0_g1_i1.p1 TRINITY_DN92780_c0_g1~~TRINITY_DN92780_c0_g1_i1.p1  ORF type:complete len:411 (-),score=51.12 TRINITY_DN92780_c0_g1_i1:58-1290(-)